MIFLFFYRGGAEGGEILQRGYNFINRIKKDNEFARRFSAKTLRSQLLCSLIHQHSLKLKENTKYNGNV